ncbi:MAG: hypothetical protein IJT36_08525 [Alphaproteobacteria bacterium]|nr:hypothetical protein [Alphaproteobacteria bacterium]
MLSAVSYLQRDTQRILLYPLVHICGNGHEQRKEEVSKSEQKTQIRLGCRRDDVICGNCGVVRYVFGCNGKKKIEREDDGVENAKISGENF